MDTEISEEVSQVLERERGHEEAKQTVTTNRMLVQNLALTNGGAVIAVLAYRGVRNASGFANLNVLLAVIFYCLGIFICPFLWSVPPANDSGVVDFLGDQVLSRGSGARKACRSTSATCDEE